MHRHEYKEIAEDLHRFTQQAHFFLTKMKLEEATGFCGARQHRWLRQGYEGINGTTEKMSKAWRAPPKTGK